MTQLYGSERAVAEGQRLHEVHQQIKGVDAKGRRYSALNPEAFYWVHATVLEGALVFQEKFDNPLSAEEPRPDLQRVAPGDPVRLPSPSTSPADARWPAPTSRVHTPPEHPTPRLRRHFRAR